MAAISDKTKSAVLAAVRRGIRHWDIADTYGISRASVSLLAKRAGLTTPHGRSFGEQAADGSPPPLIERWHLAMAAAAIEDAEHSKQRRLARRKAASLALRLIAHPPNFGWHLPLWTPTAKRRKPDN